MCGIVGYIGPKPLCPFCSRVCANLSTGDTTPPESPSLSAETVQIRRSTGKLNNLIQSLNGTSLQGEYGIGHTRWATHGRPTEENAHPHRDCTGRIVVVHNGIIENYLDLKARLQETGHRFVTETDTEVIAHLIESLMPGLSLPEAVRQTALQLRGSFAICVLSADCPETIVAARSGPPLVLGLGDGEQLVASDVPPLLDHTQMVYFLGDGEMATLKAGGVRVENFQGEPVAFTPQRITWTPAMAEKGGYRHFMLKEIHEQPRAIQDTIAGRVSLDSGRVFLDEANLAGGRSGGNRPDPHRGLRHLLARRPGRQVPPGGDCPHSGGSRLRIGIPLSGPDPRPALARGRHQPVR